MQHTDSPAAMQIASERGKLAFGQDSEVIKFGPKTQLTSILDTWGPYYIERVKAELAGTWKSQDSWGGLDSHMFAMAPYANMPNDVKIGLRMPRPRSPRASCIRSSARSLGRTASRSSAKAAIASTTAKFSV